eukprot:2613979-Ditylum_brightwellii.AAC.1
MAHSCTLICPEQKILAKANADMFVDDATLLHNAIAFHTTAIQLMQGIKNNSKLWGGLVWTTCDLLEFRKSTYFLVIWMFISAGAPSITKDEDLPPNQVKTSRFKRQHHTTTTSLTIRQHKNAGCSQSSITR